MSNTTTPHDTERDPLTGESGDHAPLSLRWDLRKFWPAMCREVPDLGEVGAAVAFALVVEAKGGGKPVSYSRDRNREYRSDLYDYTGIMRAEQVLKGGDFIESWRQTPAAPDPNATTPRMRSTMRATRTLIDLVERVQSTCPPVRVMAPRDTIVLRRDGREVRAPDTQKLNRDRRTLQRINEMLGSIVYSHGTSQLIQIYVNDLDSCGRLCAEGGAWQNIETEVRLASTINGGPLLEFDYTNTHPSMLYQLAGLAAPVDSYEIEGFPRKLLKVAFNVLVNAGDYGSAVGAIQHSKWSRKHFPDTKCRDARRLAMAAIRAVKTKHAAIEKFFHRGVGLGLMRWESKIALDVMNRLEKQDVVSLPIHDAFLVEIEHRDRLLEEMRAAADRAGLPLMRIDQKLPEVAKTAEQKASEATHEHQQIQSVIAARSDSGRGGRRWGVSSVDLVVSESKPGFENEIPIPVETSDWTISGFEAFAALFEKREPEGTPEKEILEGAEGTSQVISNRTSGIADASSLVPRSLLDLSRRQDALQMDFEQNLELPIDDGVQCLVVDPGKRQPVFIAGMTLGSPSRFRVVHFDRVMDAICSRRPSSIIIPLPPETPVTAPLKLLPISLPPAPIPAYTPGCRVFEDHPRHVGAMVNSIRAVCAVDYSSYFNRREPTFGIWQKLSLRNDEALVEILTPADGPSIVVLGRHGRQTYRIAVTGADRARAVAVAFLRNLAGTNAELPVAVVYSGPYDYGRRVDENVSLALVDLSICLPADPVFEVAPAAPARQPRPSLPAPWTPAPGFVRRQPGQSGIPADIGDQPHGSGRLLQAEAARKVAAAKAKANAESDRRF